MYMVAGFQRGPPRYRPGDADEPGGDPAGALTVVGVAFLPGVGPALDVGLLEGYGIPRDEHAFQSRLPAARAHRA